MPVIPCIPWRSVWLPRAVTAVALIVGLPLFLRSPPWCDVTLYQMAARNLLHGGVHYQDLFDTNLPGFVWAMTALYALFGPNVIVVRLVDLLIVAGVVAILDRLAKWGGATPAARWWAIAAAALFYPFTVEMSHAQRDTWMALPGLAAVALRVRRGVGNVTSPSPLAGEGGESSSRVRGETSTPPSRDPSPVGEAPPPSPARGEGKTADSPFRRSFYEGLLWGAAVWMKPHIAMMALGVWLLTARRLAGEHPRPWRAAGADLLGNLLGGLAAGAPGVLWLVASGAWGPFMEVFLEWNPWYMKLARNEFHWRVKDELFWFPPWSLGLIPTVLIALLSVLDMDPLSSRAETLAGPDDVTRRRPASLLVVLLLALAAPAALVLSGLLIADGRYPLEGASCGIVFVAILIFCRPTVRRWLPRLLWDKGAGADARFVRGTVGGLYLVWAAQAFFIQRGFPYAHVPETLLMICIWASHRWAWTLVVLLWLTVTSGVWLASESRQDVKAELDGLTPQARTRYVPRHPISDTARLRLWPECWRLNMPDAERYELWDKLRLHPPHEASIGWEEIGELAEYFRTVKRPDGGTGVRDGEVIAWFDSPHAVYLLLDIKPGLRYMHVFTAIAISCGVDESGTKGRERVLEELALAKGARFAISDLEWVALAGGDDPVLRAQFLGPPAARPTHLLPVASPYPNEFPFNQPTVFRTRNGTGRYVVHEIVTLKDTK